MAKRSAKKVDVSAAGIQREIVRAQKQLKKLRARAEPKDRVRLRMKLIALQYSKQLISNEFFL